MMAEEIRFIVEQAGCESCAGRVRSALADLLVIDEIAVDEAADAAAVRAHGGRGLEVARVDAALAQASADSGHTYRVRPGSWVTTSSS